ncbi:MAG: calcium-binding protein [Bauldia sp.]|nr:calcium-binding protein [Bauldia sp.]
MATLPSPFYSQYASGSDLSFLVNNVRPNTLFEQAFFGPGTGTDKDDIFYITEGNEVKGGKGYDAVVQADGGTLKLDKSVESGVLTGDQDGKIVGNKSDNNLVGNDGDNLLKGGDGKDVLIGNDGDDKLLGGPGNDKLSGGDGNDILKGGSGKDQLFGGDGEDVLKGGAGRDKLFGMAGDDKLFGADGKDLLIGGAGNDTLFGGNGKDELTGGDDADVFGFLKGEKGIDFITDFNFDDGDRIDLTDFKTDFSKLGFKDDGGDVVVTVGSGKNAVKFKLLGYNVSDIDPSFFQF